MRALKILLLGKSGQVGWELQGSLAPDIIVNAVAYTAVDKAETEPELARTINALEMRRYAHACRNY